MVQGLGGRSQILPAMQILDTPLALSHEAQDLLFREARTANAFTDDPVDENQIRAIYDLIKWGPTAVNSQQSTPPGRPRPIRRRAGAVPSSHGRGEPAQDRERAADRDPGL